MRVTLRGGLGPLCALAILCALTGCNSKTATPAPQANAPASGAGAQPAALTPGHSGPASLYPDPNLTPGDVFAGVTAQQVCTPGYASGVRNVTTDEKKQVYRRYGEGDVPGKAEVDHFISLELGGSNALTNLWPEPYAPVPGAHEKDKVENYLHDQVCNGTITLAQAQQMIAGDWYAVYQRITSR